MANPADWGCNPRENPYSWFIATFRRPTATRKMYSLFAQLTQLFKGNHTATLPSQDGFAHHLMERAEASAGLNPRQARELRSAASAYLRVVR